MTRKSGNKWKTKRCGRCYESHKGYSGKLDKDDREYVVCEVTNKKMFVDGSETRTLFFYTEWEKELRKVELLPGRYVFYVDVGKVSRKEAERVVEEAKQLFKQGKIKGGDVVKIKDGKLCVHPTRKVQ